MEAFYSRHMPSINLPFYNFSPFTHLHVIQAFRLVPLLSSAIQRVHADVAVLPRRHSQCLSRGVRVGNELTQLLLGNVHALVDSSVAHLHHGAQEVEVPCGIGSSTD